MRLMFKSTPDTGLRTHLLKYVSLLCLSAFIVLSSACTTDRLITRNNHDAEVNYCWQRLADSRANTEQLNKILDKEIQNYQLLVEEVLSARESALKLTQWISGNIDHDSAIPPLMLDRLNKQMAHNLALSDKVVAVVARNECWLQASEERISARGISPLDGYTRYKGFMLALSATLMLYDTYYTTASILNENDKIRQFLNQGDSGYGRKSDQLTAVTNTIFNLSNVLFVREEIDFFENKFPLYASHLGEETKDSDREASYLSASIKQSPSYPVLRKATIEYVREQQEIHSSAEVGDSLSAINRETVNGISKFFGNVVGLVEERKGKLYADKASHHHIKHQLKAGDILLEKTPFRLTDKMIPGHWGHAAIWIGTEVELKALGIWEHPIVKPYHKEIVNSQGVVEALRSGVEINSLARFMNIDDAAIIRDPAQTKTQTAERIIRTLRQIGKEYDFNYNVETTDKIVCSQLVYLAYTDIKWPTDKVIGRYTISPDNIAAKAVQSGPLELVVLYHDGKYIEHNPVALMESLMRKK